MNLRMERLGPVTVLVVAGRLDHSAAAGFQAQIEKLTGAAEDATALVIDCAELEYVASAGLRVFLLAAKNCQRNGRYFAACTLQNAVREVFELSGFGRIIPLHPDRAATLAAAQLRPA